MGVMELDKRQYYGNDCYTDRYGRTVCSNSAWNSWGRWVALVVIIIFAFLLFFFFSCITARRRRRMGYSPYRGTGWALGRTPPGHAPATYNAQPYYGAPQQEQNTTQQPYYNNSNNPPPAYHSAGANQEYYGGGRNDVELQQPGATYGGYRSGETQYAPPKGAPPGR